MDVFAVHMSAYFRRGVGVRGGYYIPEKVKVNWQGLSNLRRCTSKGMTYMYQNDTYRLKQLTRK